MVLAIDTSQANRKIRSGTEWYAFYLIQEFKKLLGSRKDVEVRLYTRDELQSDLAEGMPANFKVRILRWPLGYFWGQIRLSLEMLLHPPDVLFCPAHTVPLTSILSRQRRGRMRVFTTLHDAGFDDYPELYDRLSRWYHKWAASMAVRNAAHIFTVSEFSKERIFENYGEDVRDKVTVTYLGIDSKHAIERIESMLANYNLTPNTYLLYVGRLEPKKNILNLVKGYEKALTLNPSPEQGEGSRPMLVLAGREIDIREVDEYLAKRPELKKRIRFLGFFDEADKAALYAGAKLFLFPTLYEGFGLPILEAQAAGTPVITSNTASNPEIAGQGAVLVNPDSPYEIAEAIKSLWSNNSLREEKIRLGYENVKRFSWEETAKKTLEKLLTSPPPSP